MLNSIRTRKANDEGFTLVEMLIVIVVLGILAGITVFGIAKFREDASATACDADVKIVQTASDAYYASHKPAPAYAASMAVLQSGGYIKAVPSDVNYDGTTGVATANCAS